ncbi:hypothetical protein [Streptomyces pseudogriseolus]
MPDTPRAEDGARAVVRPPGHLGRRAAGIIADAMRGKVPGHVLLGVQ